VTLAGRGPSPAPGPGHRIGGIEKADITGEISYDPENHDRMVRLRQAKIDGIAADIPPLDVDTRTRRPRARARLGLPFGAIGAAVRRVRKAGRSVAQTHLRHLNPFPANLEDVLRRYDKVLVLRSTWASSRCCCCADGSWST